MTDDRPFDWDDPDDGIPLVDNGISWVWVMVAVLLVTGVIAAFFTL